MTKNILVLAFLCVVSFSCQKKNVDVTLTSPDGKVSVKVERKAVSDKENSTTGLFYSVECDGKLAVMSSRLGIDREDQQFSNDLEFVSVSPVKTIDEQYSLKAGKRLNVHNFANEQVFTFKNRNNALVEIIFRVANDGVAFRYRFPEESDKLHKITAELTTFLVPKDGKAWIHPYDWNSRLKPSYEQYSQNEIPVGSDSPNSKGWAYPMLFNANGLWMMITEAVLDGTYCGTHTQINQDGAYHVVFAEKEEVVLSDDPEPVSTLPWATPWRVIIVGEQLANIVETNMVQNLNEPCAIADVSWIKPGRSSWSWWSDGGSPRNFEKQIQYVDFNAEMGWEYMLIDAGWPDMKGGNVEDVIKYANGKGVGVWLWYHSGGVLSNDSARVDEFAKLEKWGAKGVKVDFFDTDKQGVVKLYEKILKDAADHHVMVNFHGASLPRGLERTYPNLMTTEAIRGAEGFGMQERCDRAAEHAAVVSFTRNVVGSMDFTPVTFSNKIRRGVEAFRRTSMGHQLALSVVFESGVQNFADKAESYRALPEKPLNFMKTVPTVWDETRLVDGYPGDFVVMARRSGKTWYIGGINGKNEPRDLSFQLPFLPSVKQLDCIADGADLNTFAYPTINKDEQNKFSIHLLGDGGFVTVVNEE